MTLVTRHRFPQHLAREGQKLNSIGLRFWGLLGEVLQSMTTF